IKIDSYSSHGRLALAYARVDFFGVVLMPRCFSGDSQLASPIQTSRSEFKCANWQNSMATNCSQLLNPLALRSASWCLTARANCPRENSCKSCEYTLHTGSMADPLFSQGGPVWEPTSE